MNISTALPKGKNTLQKKKGGIISYLEDTSDVMGEFGEGDDDGQGETAIVIKNNYYILNGDFREVYKDKTIAECLEFFLQNQDKVSCWSDDIFKEN